jgi:hypothetical protein
MPAMLAVVPTVPAMVVVVAPMAAPGLRIVIVRRIVSAGIVPVTAVAAPPTMAMALVVPTIAAAVVVIAVVTAISAVVATIVAAVVADLDAESV